MYFSIALHEQKPNHSVIRQAHAENEPSKHCEKSSTRISEPMFERVIVFLYVYVRVKPTTQAVKYKCKRFIIKQLTP